MSRVKEVTPEVMVKMKARLIEYGLDWGSSVTRGLALDMNGKEIAGHGYGACHAWLSQTFDKLCWGQGGAYYGPDGFNQKYTKDAQNFITLNCHVKKRSKSNCKPEAHEALIMWMASDDCPLSPYILNRDDKDSLANGGIIVLCGPDGATNAQVMWMCKTLRYAVEGANSVDTWYALYKAGVDALIALVVATYVRTVTGATFGYTGPEGHVAVFKTNTFNYGKGTSLPYDLSELFLRRLNPVATNTTEVFLTAGAKKSTNLPFEGFCKAVQVPDGWGGMTSSTQSDSNAFVDNVLKWEAMLKPKGDGPLVQREIKPKKPTKNTVFLEVDM